MDCIIILRVIMYLDDILPLVFELAKLGIISRPTFITHNKRTYEYLKRNYVLYEGILYVGGSLTYINKYNNRFLRHLHNLFVVKKFLCGPILTIEQENNIVSSSLASMNRILWKGKKVRSLIVNRRVKDAIKENDYYRVVLGSHLEKSRRVLKGYDGVLLSHSKDDYERIGNEELDVDCPIIRVGYTRALPEWQRFLREKSDAFFPKSIKEPYFFFVLNRMGIWLEGENCVRSGDLFKECIAIFREFNDDIMTVFRPHNNTDMEEVQEILEDIGYKNYVVTYCHPRLLTERARFTFSYVPTTLFIDAHLNGCPTVEYADYDSRFYTVNHGEAMYTDCVDYFIHRDRGKLREVVEHLAGGRARSGRNYYKARDDLPVLSTDEVGRKFDWLVKRHPQRASGP